MNIVSNKCPFNPFKRHPIIQWPWKSPSGGFSGWRSCLMTVLYGGVSSCSLLPSVYWWNSRNSMRMSWPSSLSQADTQAGDPIAFSRIVHISDASLSDPAHNQDPLYRDVTTFPWSAALINWASERFFWRLVALAKTCSLLEDYENDAGWSSRSVVCYDWGLLPVGATAAGSGVTRFARWLVSELSKPNTAEMTSPRSNRTAAADKKVMVYKKSFQPTINQ